MKRREFLASSLALPLLAQEGRRQIVVNAGEAAGRIRCLQGVNTGPEHNRPGIPEIRAQYRELKISSVRTHDFYGPADLDAWRPGQPWDQILFPRWDADPEDPRSYNFAPTDRLIAAIAECGAAVYFRLGRSWDAVPAPPADPGKWAEIASRVVLHYNQGWAGGFTLGVKYWEVWNEPDGRFWSGSPEEFFTLYEKTARKLKGQDPELKVGACGLATSSRPGPYREGFLHYCAERRVPLDFYSWHRYAFPDCDPYGFVRVARVIRGLLDQAGFEHAESHLTEWNLDAGVKSPPGLQDSMINAAFTAAALIYLQDAPLEAAHYYRGDAAHPMGLFFNDGRPKNRAHAFRAMARLLDTPERLAATGGDTAGFAVLAGRSEDGRRVRVFLSNYEIQPFDGPAPVYRDNRGYELEVRDLPWGDGGFKVERYRVAAGDDFVLEEAFPDRGGVFRLHRDLAPPAFELIELEAAG